MPFPFFRRSKSTAKSQTKDVDEKDMKKTKKDSEISNLPPVGDDDGELSAIANETNHLLQRITTVSPSRKRPRKVVGRVTIEVLDSFPASARPVDHEAATSPVPPPEKVVEIPALTPIQTGDAFGFEEEECRVRSTTDIFVPAVVAGKKELETQLEALTHEKERLKRKTQTMQPLVLPTPEVDNDVPQTRSRESESKAATQIQAAARGYIARQDTKRRIADKSLQTPKKKVRLRPVDGSQATRSQDEQPEWREITDPDRGETWYYNTQTGQSQWESPIIPLSFPALGKPIKQPRPSSVSMNNNQATASSFLPALSPTSNTTAPRFPATQQQAASPRQPSTNAATLLPAIQKESLLLQDFDDDIPSAPSHATTTPQTHPTDAADGEMVDWMDDTALFLADGSKNNKLRDTIRDALKISKFDSVSALLTSSISFNAKRAKYHRPDSLTTSSSSAVSRDIVLGRKPDTFMVAVLAKDSGNLKGKKQRGSKHKERLRIRDVADSGFMPPDGDGAPKSPGSKSPARTISSPTKDATPKQCFACWSAIKGCLCEEHRDPFDNRPRPASESALMCSNWEIDQLRRKYRAEEIQEIFMKANSSLRYDKQRKAYITIIECRHPIYRAVEAMLTIFNKTMRRKLHTRAWFRSYIEQLRLGRVAHTSPPSLLKLRDTLRNGKWCQSYSDSVVQFHPKAPVTQKSFSPIPTHETIAIDPATPDFRHWVLKTECPVPKILYQPRKYELLPRRCIPMPQPSFLDQIPLPVPNRFIDGCEKISWVERLCARLSQASLYRAVAQIKACTPPMGFDKPRRTRVTPPCCVLFANFGRKTSPGNLAIGGLVAELLIYLIVTTFVPPQFGNFTVTDRRAICPKTTPDHSAVYVCLEIDPTTLKYVIRPLEHALNTRRPPTIMICIQGEEYQVCVNRPEQTSEEAYFGFRTILEWIGLSVPEETRAVTFVPSGDVLTFNTPAFNATVTTRADRYYPFCEPTTRESTIAEFMHLLWMGKSSRNQPQCFTNLGSQDPGDFMKNCNVDGAMGQCIPVVYRSWAFMQGSPFEEFVTDEGIAYWYDKRTGITYWERPLLDQEKHRGDDGDIEGVVVDGKGEKATIGVGAPDARYSQQDMRKYRTKTMENPLERDARLKSVRVSAAKHDIVLKPEVVAVKEPPAPRISRIQVPPLPFQDKTMDKSVSGLVPHKSDKHLLPPPSSRSSSPTKSVKQHPSGGPVVNEETKKLIDSLTQAIGASMAQSNVMDVLQLGIGLGMGLGLKSNNILEENETNVSGDETDRTNVSGDETDRSETTARPVTTMPNDDTMTATTRTERSVTLDATPDELAPGEKVAHPFGTDYVTHPPPGEGESWINKPVDFSEESQTAVDGFRGAVHRSVAALPRNFVECASTTKTVKMEANYLPSMNNKNQPRSMGIVRPRTSADEWLTVGYDPWVAGKELFNTEFVNSLAVEDEDKAPVAGAAFVDTNEHAARQEVVTQAAKEALELEHLFSLCRHGKYAEVENLLNQPDWTIPIDAKDNAGNTLLSIACQNNNKRIAKLCLRKGAELNTQNLNGQTVLHYTHAYGFHDLMEYLMEKGAKDDILNKDGLTCYEGLSSEAVDAI
ncbi:Aste57867_472 [Aphanomyces stellatus]|uniref:Aste57867_472 protein n=1 Tax=Aphanomyces stellatus TaxID=120398 RepID=A0A485K3W7_9STRA|nr:hypothetical protein As57867_000471 [Aphanomyces stellatus]VFT77697.1 Aste57867_472 [Aphanomyces stellatus]